MNFSPQNCNFFLLSTQHRSSFSNCFYFIRHSSSSFSTTVRSTVTNSDNVTEINDTHDKVWETLWHFQPQFDAFTYLNVMMLGCLSLRRCLISVSLMSLTFFTATSSPWNLPRNTAPWAPLPTHWSSEISSKGTSQDSEEAIMDAELRHWPKMPTGHLDWSSDSVCDYEEAFAFALT